MKVLNLTAQCWQVTFTWKHPDKNWLANHTANVICDGAARAIAMVHEKFPDSTVHAVTKRGAFNRELLVTSAVLEGI